MQSAFNCIPAQWGLVPKNNGAGLGESHLVALLASPVWHSKNRTSLRPLVNAYLPDIVISCMLEDSSWRLVTSIPIHEAVDPTSPKYCSVPCTNTRFMQYRQLIGGMHKDYFPKVSANRTFNILVSRRPRTPNYHLLHLIGLIEA